MVKTILEIDGMMCGMCEAHVNDVIRKVVPEAKKIKSSHTKGLSSFITTEEPNKEELIIAIAETGYTVLKVESKPYTKKILGIFDF